MAKQNTLEKELAEIKGLLAGQALQNDEPLTMDEACLYTGFKKSYLYKLTCFNEIPYFKPNGKKIYFSKKELKEWIFRKRRKSNAEIKEASDKYFKKNFQ